MLPVKCAPSDSYVPPPMGAVGDIFYNRVAVMRDLITILVMMIAMNNDDDCKKQKLISTPGHIIVTDASSENKGFTIRYPACTIPRVCEIKGRSP